MVPGRGFRVEGTGLRVQSVWYPSRSAQCVEFVIAKSLVVFVTGAEETGAEVTCIDPKIHSKLWLRAIINKI